LSTSEAATIDLPTRPAPVSGVKLALMRFKIQDSIYMKKSTPNEFSVEVKFQKYISGSISSEKTSILQFWEVRYD
jgi:hypothetical protein